MESVNRINSGVIFYITYSEWQLIKNVVLAFSKAQKSRLGHTQPPTQWVLGILSPLLKRPEREAGPLPPSIAEVKNE
jgi:hypothetical protein